MQKINKVFVSLIVSCMIFAMIPFKVSADQQNTYTVISANECQAIYSYVRSNSTYYYHNEFSIDMRAVKIINGSNIYYYFVSDQQGYYSSNTDQSSSCPFVNPPSSNIGGSIVVDNHTYYSVVKSDSYVHTDIVDIPSFNVLNEGALYTAVYYTFGDGAVDPVPSLNYGDLVVGFHTNFSASGTTNNYTITNNTNLDTIEWENVDSNGNDLQNKGINVEIRAVPILYSANSKSALDLLGFQDAVVDSNNGLILWQGNFNDNHKSFIWNDVIHQLQTSNPAFTITSLLTGSVWTRYGWIYQIRYNDVLNGYTSNWQTIYNSTSIKVSDSEKIVNQYYYHYPSGVGSDDQDIFHDINTVNNTTNNWYVNDVPVDPDASWLDALIQAIAEILGKILDFFSSIFDGLVDLLLGLFGDINPADSFFNWFSDLFNGIGDIDLTLPQFNIPSADLSSFNRLVQETMDIFSLNNFGFVIFIPLLLIIIKAVF